MHHNATGNVYRRYNSLNVQQTPKTSNDSEDAAAENETEQLSIFEEYFGYAQQYSEMGTAFFWNLNAASVGQISGNFSICQGNLSVLYNSTTTVYEQYADLYFAEAGYSTYEILVSVDPIIFSCYYSLFEYWVAIQIYGSTGMDINKLTYNFAHNLGKIYDMSEEAIVRSWNITQNYDDIEYWARMGTIIGSNFQNVFEDPVNYYPFDPEKDLERY